MKRIKNLVLGLAFCLAFLSPINQNVAALDWHPPNGGVIKQVKTASNTYDDFIENTTPVRLIDDMNISIHVTAGNYLHVLFELNIWNPAHYYEAIFSVTVDAGSKSDGSWWGLVNGTYYTQWTGHISYLCPSTKTMNVEIRGATADADHGTFRVTNRYMTVIEYMEAPSSADELGRLNLIFIIALIVAIPISFNIGRWFSIKK